MNRKIVISSLLPIVCLMSCSNKINPVGTYSFMLGKSSDTHIGISMNLTDEDHIVEKTNESGEKVKEVVGKNFVANLSGGDQFKVDIEDLDLPIPSGVDIDELNEAINNFLGETLKNLKGYYTVSDIESNYGYRLKLGSYISIPQEISPTGLELDIPPTILEHIFASFINEKAITLQIPVSMDDLFYQLCWYGIYINAEDVAEQYLYYLDRSKLPGEIDENKRIGTHPQIKYDNDGKTIVENQIDLMNKNYAYEFSNTPVYVDSKIVGKIYETSREEIKSDGETVTVYEHYFYRSTIDGVKWTPVSPTFNAVMKFRNSYGIYDVDTNVEITLDKDELERLDYAKIVGPVVGGEIQHRNNFMKPAFVFRDYNDIKISLNKE